MTDVPWDDGVGRDDGGVDVIGNVNNVNGIDNKNNSSINNKDNGSINTSNAKKASIDEDIKKEPIIQTIIDIFDGEVLN